MGGDEGLRLGSGNGTAKLSYAEFIHQLDMSTVFLHRYLTDRVYIRSNHPVFLIHNSLIMFADCMRVVQEIDLLSLFL